MAINLGTAVVGTAVSLAGLTSGMNQAKSIVSTATATINDVFAGIGNAMTGNFGAKFEELVKVFKDAGTAGAELNSQLEIAQGKWTGFLHSAEAAHNQVRALLTLAEQRGFKFEEVDDASRKLEIFGGHALNTIDNLVMVENVSKETSRPVEQVGQAFGRLFDALQGGRPFAQVSRQLQLMGVLTIDTRQHLEDMQAQGKSSQEMWDYFTSTIQRYNGASERVAHTMSGTMISIKTQVADLASIVGKPMFDLMLDGLQQVLKALQNPAVMLFAKQVGQAMAEVTAAIANLVEAIAGGHWEEAWAIMTNAADVAFNRLEVSALGTIGGLFQKLDQLFGGNTFKGPQQLVDGWIAGLNANAPKLQDHTRNVFQGQIAPAIDNAGKDIPVQEYSSALLDRYTAGFTSYDWTNLKSVSKGIRDLFQSTLVTQGGSISSDLLVGIDQIEGHMAGAIEAMNRFNAAGDKSSDAAKAAMADYQRFIQEINDTIAESGKENSLPGGEFEAIRKDVQDLIDATIKLNTVDEQNAQATRAAKDAQDEFQRITKETQAAVKGATAALKEQQDAARDHADFFKSLSDPIQAQLDIVRAAAQENAAMWTGIIDGIQDAVNAAQSTAKANADYFKGIIDGMKDELDGMQEEAAKHQQEFEDKLAPLQRLQEQQQAAQQQHALIYQAILNDNVEIVSKELGEQDDVTKAIREKWEAEITGRLRASTAANKEVTAAEREERRRILEYDEKIHALRAAGAESEARALEKARDQYKKGADYQIGLLRERAAVSKDNLDEETDKMTEEQKRQAEIDKAKGIDTNSQIKSLQDQQKIQKDIDDARIKAQQALIDSEQKQAEAQAKQDQKALDAAQARLKAAQDGQKTDQDDYKAQEQSLQNQLNAIEARRKAVAAEDEAHIRAAQDTLQSVQDEADKRKEAAQAELEAAQERKQRSDEALQAARDQVQAVKDEIALHDQERKRAATERQAVADANAAARRGREEGAKVDPNPYVDDQGRRKADLVDPKTGRVIQELGGTDQQFAGAQAAAGRDTDYIPAKGQYVPGAVNLPGGTQVVNPATGQVVYTAPPDTGSPSGGAEPPASPPSAGPNVPTGAASGPIEETTQKFTAFGHAAQLSTEQLGSFFASLSTVIPSMGILQFSLDIAVVAFRHWDEITKTMSATWNSFRESLERNVGGPLRELVSGTMERIGPAMSNIGIVIGAVFTATNRVMTDLIEVVGRFISKMGPVLGPMWDLLTNSLGQTIDVLKGIWFIFLDLIGLNFGKLGEDIKNLGSEFIGHFWTSLKDIGAVLKNLIPVIVDGIKAAAEFLGPELAGLGVWIKDTALPAIWDGIKALGTWLKETAGPALLDGIKALGAWIKDTGGPALLDGIKALGAWLKDTAGPAIWNGIKAALDGIKNIFEDHWKQIVITALMVPFAIPLLLGAALAKLWPNIKEGLESLGTSISTHWMNFWHGIGDFLGNVGGWIADAPGKISAWFVNFFTKTLPDAIGAVIGEMFNVGLKVVFAIYDGIVENGPKILQWFRDLPGKIRDAFLAVGEWKTQMWNQFVSSAYEAMISVGNFFIHTVPDAARAGWNAVKAHTAEAWNAIKSAGRTAFDDTVAFFRGLPGDARAAWNAVKATTIEAWDAATTALGNAWTAVTNFFVRTLPKLAKDGWNHLIVELETVGSSILFFFEHTLPDAVGFAAAWVKEKLVEAWNWVGNTGLEILKGLINFFEHTLPDSVGSAIGWVKDKFGELLDGMHNVIVNIIEGVGGWFQELGTAIAGHMDTEILQRWNNFWDGLKKTIGGIIGGLQTDLGAAFKGLGTFLDDIPIVGGIAKAFEWLYDHLVGHSVVPETINGIIGEFNKLLDQGPKIIQGMIDSVVTIITGLWDKVKGPLGGVASNIKGIFGSLFGGNDKKGNADDPTKQAGDEGATAGQQFSDQFKVALGEMVVAISGVVAQMGDSLRSTLGDLIGFLTTSINGLSEHFTTVMGQMQTNAVVAGPAVPGAQVPAPLTGEFTGAMVTLEDSVVAFGNVVHANTIQAMLDFGSMVDQMGIDKSTLITAFDNATTSADAFQVGVSNDFTLVKQDGTQNISDLSRNIVTIINNLPAATKQALDTFTSAVGLSFEGAKTVATIKAQEIVTSTVNVLRGMPSAIGSAIGEWSGFVSAQLSGMQAAIVPVMETMVNAIAEKFNSLISKTNPDAQQMTQGIFAWFKWLYDQLVGHSVVPDLVRDTGTWFTLWSKQSVSTATVLATGVNDQVTGMSDHITTKMSVMADTLATPFEHANDRIAAANARLIEDQRRIHEELGRVMETTNAKRTKGVNEAHAELEKKVKDIKANGAMSPEQQDAEIKRVTEETRRRIEEINSQAERAIQVAVARSEERLAEAQTRFERGKNLPVPTAPSGAPSGAAPAAGTTPAATPTPTAPGTPAGATAPPSTVGAPTAATPVDQLVAKITDAFNYLLDNLRRLFADLMTEIHTLFGERSESARLGLGQNIPVIPRPSTFDTTAPTINQPNVVPNSVSTGVAGSQPQINYISYQTGPLVEMNGTIVREEADIEKIQRAIAAAQIDAFHFAQRGLPVAR
jgi:hypothetical protein